MFVRFTPEETYDILPPDPSKTVQKLVKGGLEIDLVSYQNSVVEKNPPQKNVVFPLFALEGKANGCFIPSLGKGIFFPP